MKGQEDNMKLIPKRQWITGGNENIFALSVQLGCKLRFTERDGVGL